MPDPIPEALKNKKDALEFIEINIEMQAEKIEVVKNPGDDGYVGTAGPYAE